MWNGHAPNPAKGAGQKRCIVFSSSSPPERTFSSPMFSVKSSEPAACSISSLQHAGCGTLRLGFFLSSTTTPKSRPAIRIGTGCPCAPPMYAAFLWAAVGTLLATLNWLIAWCVFGLVLLTLRRIETEERILIELFGARYLEYRRRVSALGPPWRCLGYDAELGGYRVHSP